MSINIYNLNCNKISKQKISVTNYINVFVNSSTSLQLNNGRKKLLGWIKANCSKFCNRLFHFLNSFFHFFCYIPSAPISLHFPPFDTLLNWNNKVVVNLCFHKLGNKLASDWKSKEDRIIYMEERFNKMNLYSAAIVTSILIRLLIEVFHKLFATNEQIPLVKTHNFKKERCHMAIKFTRTLP